jgi:hypothetical protein
MSCMERPLFQRLLAEAHVMNAMCAFVRNGDYWSPAEHYR